jgi:hypothetical protein
VSSNFNTNAPSTKLIALIQPYSTYLLPSRSRPVFSSLVHHPNSLAGCCITLTRITRITLLSPLSSTYSPFITSPSSSAREHCNVSMLQFSYLLNDTEIKAAEHKYVLGFDHAQRRNGGWASLGSPGLADHGPFKDPRTRIPKDYYHYRSEKPCFYSPHRDRLVNHLGIDSNRKSTIR